jgi:hypothetical protein
MPGCALAAEGNFRKQSPMSNRGTRESMSSKLQARATPAAKKNWRTSLNSVLDETLPKFWCDSHHHCSEPGKLQRMVYWYSGFTAAVSPLIASNKFPTPKSLYLARTGWPLSFNSRGFVVGVTVPTFVSAPCQHYGKFWRYFRSPTVCAPSPINHA